MELTLKEVEVAKLNLQPGDTLFVTLKSDNMDESTLKMVRKSFERYFLNNTVCIICVGQNEDVRFSVIAGRV